MTKEKLTKYWTDFKNYPEYADFTGYPEQILTEALDCFELVMTSVTPKPIKRWGAKEINAGLTALADATSDEDNEGLIITYDITAAYLRYLAEEGKISASFDDLETVLIDFEEKEDLQGPVLPADTLFSDPGERSYQADLPEWREYIANDIMAYSQEWLRAYFETPTWQNTTSDIDQGTLEMIIETLVRTAYDEYRKTPKSWTKKAITGVMTGRLIRNVNLTATDYQALAPAVTEFLAFVGQNGWLNAKRVSDYQRFINAAAPEMIALSQDRQNFGPAKLIGEKLQASGIDLSDRAAVDDFIQQINADGGVDSLYGEDDLSDENDEQSADVDELKKIMADPTKFAQVARAYDPDPQADYLMASHQSKEVGWQRKTAVKVHELAVQTGLRLWLKRDNYHFPAGSELSDVMSNAMEFIDVLYAQSLVTPAEWTVAVLREIGTWFQSHEVAEYDEMKKFIVNLVDSMYNDGILSKKQAGQLPAAFAGKAIPTVETPKKVKGKVISMKQARKLLKNKRRR